MKNLAILVLISIIFYSCIARQKIITKEEQSDILVFENEVDFSLKQNHYNKSAIRDSKHLVVFQKWRGYGGEILTKSMSFTKVMIR